MHTKIPAAITTVEEAKAFIRDLKVNGELFHFDDSPRTVINHTGICPFTPQECEQLEKVRHQLFHFNNFDPFDYALNLDPDYRLSTDRTRQEFIDSKKKITDIAEIDKVVTNGAEPGEYIQKPWCDAIYVYAGCYYIEEYGSMFHLGIENCSYSNNSLEELENILWLWVNDTETL